MRTGQKKTDACLKNRTEYQEEVHPLREGSTHEAMAASSERREPGNRQRTVKAALIVAARESPEHETCPGHRVVARVLTVRWSAAEGGQAVI